MRTTKTLLKISFIPFLILFTGVTSFVTTLHGQVREAWVARYGGTGVDEARGIVMDGHENAYVTGSSEGSGSSFDYATVKYDGNGNQVGSGAGKDIVVDNSGHVYVTGYVEVWNRYLSCTTICYDTSGNELWVAVHDSTQGANSCQEACSFTMFRGVIFYEGGGGERGVCGVEQKPI